MSKVAWEYQFVQLATLKRREEKAARTAGRTPTGSTSHRLVPLSDTHYVSQLQMMIATLKIPQGVSLDIENYCTVSLYFEQAYL